MFYVFYSHIDVFTTMK